MSDELQVGLVVGLLSGGFALLGVALGDWAAKRREDRQFRTATALELADTERHVWGESWVELNVNLQRQEVRLAVAGAPPELVQELRNMSLFCWYDHQREDPQGERGISTELLDARRGVSLAIANHILRKGTAAVRNQAERDAVENAQRIRNDDLYQEHRDWMNPPEHDPF